MAALRACFRPLALTSSCGRRFMTTAPACIPRLATRSASAVMQRPFTVSARVRGQGSTDTMLAQRFAEELQYEKEAVASLPAGDPEFLKGFKKQGIWTIEDIPGTEDITLTRTFGNETIQCTFSTLDIQGHTGEFEAEEEEEGGELDGDEAPSQQIRVSFTISKPTTNSAINVDTMCEGGTFVVDNIAFYEDGKLATETTAEADWKRRGLYLGPHFDTLDEQLATDFVAYMEERGMNESLALFIAEFVEHKDQKEYVGWLQNIKKFVES